MPDAQKLLMTMTGEIHQPVRLYYELYDKAKVLQVFKALRCMQFDLDQQRLPTGPDYLYVRDAAAAVERAQRGLADWKPGSEL